MKLTNKWIEGQSGLEATAVYEDVDDFSHLPYEECSQVTCFAFHKGKLLVVKDGDKNAWGPTGGGIEKPETFEECARRELLEEANVKMLDFKPIGCQKAWLSKEPHKCQHQLRVFCNVKPIGDFVEDPDGDITEIKWIDPKDYKKYFDWGKISDRILERALEFHAE